eukprot:CAMPEP_0196662958 /NCGR_PEP_ID=MMETSP1086-20130531/51017_1 /TAXON_ID=77921 /ORGANISM="Cyanoptyche  gloeocystis , Strain SAG4.97" /LENGTH=51 /DNA_ID=CAMNT_0041998595 /DNA_START=136 /DNA_END=291 /DNA_ORIENTATION=+
MAEDFAEVPCIIDRIPERGVIVCIVPYEQCYPLLLMLHPNADFSNGEQPNL